MQDASTEHCCNHFACQQMQDPSLFFKFSHSFLRLPVSLYNEATGCIGQNCLHDYVLHPRTQTPRL